MKKLFKILHIPSAKYVWDWLDINNTGDGCGSIYFLANDICEVEEYLNHRDWACVNSVDDDVVLFSKEDEREEKDTDFHRHEFEIIEVTDEDV